MDTSKKKLGSANPVRFSEEVEAQINEAANALGLAKQDVIRMACAIGLRQLKAINYDVTGAVMDKAQPDKQTIRYSVTEPEELLRVAEGPAGNLSKRRSA